MKYYRANGIKKERDKSIVIAIVKDQLRIKIEDNDSCDSIEIIIEEKQTDLILDFLNNKEKRNK